VTGPLNANYAAAEGRVSRGRGSLCMLAASDFLMQIADTLK